MKWFETKKQTDKELQDELRALCDRIIADQYSTPSRMNRYEELLKEIYSRNLEPIIKLIPSRP